MIHALNVNRILLPPATRTATTATAKQIDVAAHALRAYVNVTSTSGSGSLTVVFRGYDRVTQNPVQLSSGGIPITSTGLYVFEMYRGAVVNPLTGEPLLYGAIIDVCPRPVPYEWDIAVLHGDGSSYTYSMSCDVIAN